MRKLSILLVCSCLLFVTGFAGYRTYKIGKPKLLVRQARGFLKKADTPKALLCLRQALQTDPNNLDACRLMAELTESAGLSQDSIMWRTRVVERAPHSLSERLALVRLAITVGDFALAQRTLDGVSESERKSADYQKLSGIADVSTHRLTEAEEHFSLAVRLEPTNAVSQLNLATLRLQHTNSDFVKQARVDLQDLCMAQLVRCDALRELTLDACGQSNLAAAFLFSSQLVKETNSAFTDRIRHLNILRALGSNEREPFLTALKFEATYNSTKAHDLGKSLVSVLGAEATLNWLRSLPQETRTNPPVPLLEADCSIALKDWPGLLTNLIGESWGPLDCLRLACRTRALKELGQPASAKAEWVWAMKAADSSTIQILQQLHATLTSWSWHTEQEDVLWVVVRKYPREQWALRALAEQLANAGRTRSLLTLFEQVGGEDSSNLEIANNLALTAMLLGAWEKKPHEIALAVYSKNPTNSAFVSTYAFSLLVQKKTTEALRTIEQLNSQQLLVPSTAAYYGLILSQAGDTQKAARYLEIASRTRLLPEEQKLVERAMKVKGT